MNEPGLNNSSSTTNTSDSIYQSTTFAVLMSSTIVFALVGNSLVLFTVCYSSGYHHRPVSIYIISLAIGDMITAVLSITAELHWDVLGQGRYGNVACKVSTYTQSQDGIVGLPSDTTRPCSRLAGSSAAVIPQSAFRSDGRGFTTDVDDIPQLFIFLQVETGVSSDGHPQLACRSHGYTANWQRKLNVSWLALCVFVAPLCAMTISGVKVATTIDIASLPFALGKPFHQRSSDGRFRLLSRIKLRTIKVTILVLVAHTFCWAPYFSVNLLNVWTDYRLKDSVPYVVVLVSQCAAWFSSCVNPIIYAVFSLTVAHLKGVFCCGLQHPSPVTHQPFRARARHVNSYSSFRRDTARNSRIYRSFYGISVRRAITTHQAPEVKDLSILLGETAFSL